MTLGITSSNVSPQGFLKLEEAFLLYPLIASVNYFSSATDGGNQGSFDISAATQGTAVFLSVSGKRPLRIGRLPTLTVTDAAITAALLSCTVRVIGRRFGRLVTQDLVMTTSGTTR